MTNTAQASKHDQDSKHLSWLIGVRKIATHTKIEYHFCRDRIMVEQKFYNKTTYLGSDTRSELSL